MSNLFENLMNEKLISNKEKMKRKKKESTIIEERKHLGGKSRIFLFKNDISLISNFF